MGQLYIYGSNSTAGPVPLNGAANRNTRGGSFHTALYKSPRKLGQIRLAVYDDSENMPPGSVQIKYITIRFMSNIDYQTRKNQSAELCRSPNTASNATYQYFYPCTDDDSRRHLNESIVQTSLAQWFLRTWLMSLSEINTDVWFDLKRMRMSMVWDGSGAQWTWLQFRVNWFTYNKMKWLLPNQSTTHSMNGIFNEWFVWLAKSATEAQLSAQFMSHHGSHPHPSQVQWNMMNYWFGTALSSDGMSRTYKDRCVSNCGFIAK